MSSVKKYNEDDGRFGKAAETAVQNWLINNGYDVTELPHGKFKWDCKAVSDTEEALVEVERRNSWTHGQFPFPTVHVPLRRYKSGDSWLFIVRRDLNASLVAFFRYFLSSRVLEIANKCVAAGEQFFDMPVLWCLPIDMSDRSGLTIAERNKRRVLKLYDDAKRYGGTEQYKRQILGPLSPYGMPDAIWNRLIDEATDEGLPQRLRNSDTSQRSLF